MDSSKIGLYSRLSVIVWIRLYYSYSKNEDTKCFYIRRVRRLLIPFVIMSLWYFLYVDIISSFKPIEFLGRITSIAFWFQGNYCGMWYVAISVLIYALFPILYKFIFSGLTRDNSLICNKLCRGG